MYVPCSNIPKRSRWRWRAQDGAWLPQELQARRTNLRKAQRSLTQQIERLTTAYLEQIRSLDEYRRRRQDLELRVTALAQQAAQLDVQVDRQTKLMQAIEHITTFCQRVRVLPLSMVDNSHSAFQYAKP